MNRVLVIVKHYFKIVQLFNTITLLQPWHCLKVKTHWSYKNAQNYQWFLNTNNTYILTTKYNTYTYNSRNKQEKLYTRHSQSVIFFNNKSKQGEETNNRTSKTKHEEQTLNILVEQTSTCTPVDEDANQMTSSLQQTPATNKSKEQAALKLNRLKDKVTRYESHKDFLTRGIVEKLNQRV